MSPWVTVIIVNYNAKRFLQGALDALACQTDQRFHVILVDNASGDGSLDGLKTDHLPSYQLIASEENLGFAAGNNLAAKAAVTDWIALLNPDTEASDTWIAALAEAVAAHRDVSMFAGATLDMTDPTKMDGAGDCYFGLGLPWRGGYQRPVREMPEAGSCFSPCGAAALFKREVFLEAGGFDERYFCYCEDVDLAFRLRLQGHDCVFWPEASILHFGSGTTSVASPFAVRHGTRNRIWTFAKNMPPIALSILAPLHLFLTGALIIRAILRGQARSTLAGIWDALKGFGPIWRERHALAKRRRLSSIQVLKAMSWNPLRMLQHRPDVRPLSRNRRA